MFTVLTAVTMTVISTVHPVHLMNAAQRQAAADRQTKPADLCCESAYRLLSFTSTITLHYTLWCRELIKPQNEIVLPFTEAYFHGKCE